MCTVGASCLVACHRVQAESGAILLYLLDKCGSGSQLPLPTRAKLVEWVLFANSTLPDCCFGPKRWVPATPAAAVATGGHRQVVPMHVQRATS